MSNRDDATKYLNRRSMRAGCASTLRKAMRGQRIANGDRPLRMSRSHLVPVGEFFRDGVIYEVCDQYILRPTKGWKFAERITQKAA